MHKWGNAIARSMCWAIFSRYCGHRTMTIKGAKRNVPHLLQAQQAPICLWSISETLQCQKFRGTVTKSTVSNRVCMNRHSIDDPTQVGCAKQRPTVLVGDPTTEYHATSWYQQGRLERKMLCQCVLAIDLWTPSYRL